MTFLPNQTWVDWLELFFVIQLAENAVVHKWCNSGQVQKDEIMQILNVLLVIVQP